MIVCKVWCRLFRSKHSTVLLLCLLRNSLHQTLPHTFSNKSYRIHEISFDLSPESTFETGFNSGQHQTYMEYYKNQYGIEIRDKKQPLLIHRMKRSELPDGKNDFIFYALSFYVTKTLLVGPKWFWSDQIDLDLTIMIWAQPKWIGQVQMWFFLVVNHNLDLTNSFWS